MSKSIKARFFIKRRDFALDVDMEVPACGLTAITGPSGCGKTTLLRAMAGLEHDLEGFCRIGDDLWQDGKYFLPTHKRSIGYVFQQAELFAHMSVQKNLQYGWKRLAPDMRKVTMDEAIELLGLEHLLERHPDNLSGGERQRVAIARALLTSPQLLLMDEPLASLDEKSKREIMPFIERLRDELEMPVLYVTHSADELARLADHLVIMKNGRLRHSGELGLLLTRLDIAKTDTTRADAVIEAKISAHDDKYHLSTLDFSGGKFTVAAIPRPLGQKARLRILARDVSLAISPQTNSSILNIFPATVDDMASAGQSQMIVRLDMAGTPLLSLITRKSADILKLSPGDKVYAQIKAVALL